MFFPVIEVRTVCGCVSQKRSSYIACSRIVFLRVKKLVTLAFFVAVRLTGLSFI